MGIEGDDAKRDSEESEISKKWVEDVIRKLKMGKSAKVYSLVSQVK